MNYKDKLIKYLEENGEYKDLFINIYKNNNFIDSRNSKYRILFNIIESELSYFYLDENLECKIFKTDSINIDELEESTFLFNQDFKIFYKQQLDSFKEMIDLEERLNRDLSDKNIKNKTRGKIWIIKEW